MREEQMPKDAIFLTIRPKYAQKILDGTKTVELRRIYPKRIDKDVLVLLYVSSPVKSLVGAFRVESVVEAPLNKLWGFVKYSAGITRNEFFEYYKNVNRGVGIFIKDVWRFPEPIALYTLQAHYDFLPPQSFRYAKSAELLSPHIAKSIKHISL